MNVENLEIKCRTGKTDEGYENTYFPVFLVDGIEIEGKLKTHSSIVGKSIDEIDRKEFLQFYRNEGFDEEVIDRLSFWYGQFTHYSRCYKR